MRASHGADEMIRMRCQIYSGEVVEKLKPHRIQRIRHTLSTILQFV
jgi:hypothetical protein